MEEGGGAAVVDLAPTQRRAESVTLKPVTAESSRHDYEGIGMLAVDDLQQQRPQQEPDEKADHAAAEAAGGAAQYFPGCAT